MFTVALIGPDGAGKTTVCRELERTLCLPVKYIYMGSNPDSSNYLLPTTRLINTIKRMFGAELRVGGPPDLRRINHRPKSALKRLIGAPKSVLGLTNWIGEEFFRLILAWYYRRRGYIVLCDRHFISDYYAYDLVSNGTERSLASRFHGFTIDCLCPKPDLVICLDAPAEVLFARKNEGTPEALERLRQEHRKLRDVIECFTVVDASRSLKDVTGDVIELISDFHKSKTSKNL